MSPTEFSIDNLGPLTLHPVDVTAVGVLRAAFNAVHDHPVVVDSFERARRTDAEALRRHASAAGNLARRTAGNYAAEAPTF